MTNQLDLFPESKLQQKQRLIKIKAKECFYKSMKPTLYIGFIIPSIIFWLVFVYTDFSLFNTIKLISLLGALYSKVEVTRQLFISNNLVFIYLNIMFFTFVVIYTSIFIPALFTFPAKEVVISTKTNNGGQNNE
jgi:hypothetical protein